MLPSTTKFASASHRTIFVLEFQTWLELSTNSEIINKSLQATQVLLASSHTSGEIMVPIRTDLSGETAPYHRCVTIRVGRLPKLREKGRTSSGRQAIN
jgi:hypothetical protein